jgi:uncharacterized protein YraI
MRHVDSRATAGRGLAVALAVLLALGIAFPAVQAQENAPVAGPATITSDGNAVLLRGNPGYDASVLTTLGDGSALDVAGSPVTAADGSTWLPVVANGQSGYVPAGYVATAPATDAAPTDGPPVSDADAADPIPVSVSATTTDTNLRADPSANAAVLEVLPPGTTLSVNGAQENGFVPVTVNGSSGWVAVELLAQGTEPATVETDGTTASEPAPLVATDDGAAAEAAPFAAPAPNSSTNKDRRDSTGIVWPFSGGQWEVVQGYNNGTHTNRSDFAQYKYAMDWARSDGNTAGQSIYAPLSGTIQWIDRGSGGILVDAGNGYGVALFHVTYVRGLAGGDQVERGQRIGQISGPGGDGYESMAHVEIDSWRLNGNGHESVPFDGPNAIAGQEFPDTGGTDQYMGATVSP